MPPSSPADHEDAAAEEADQARDQGVWQVRLITAGAFALSSVGLLGLISVIQDQTKIQVQPETRSSPTIVATPRDPAIPTQTTPTTLPTTAGAALAATPAGTESPSSSAAAPAASTGSPTPPTPASPTTQPPAAPPSIATTTTAPRATTGGS